MVTIIARNTNLLLDFKTSFAKFIFQHFYRNHPIHGGHLHCRLIMVHYMLAY